MKTAEIRSRFLKYFEKNKHTIVESSSIVPSNDPSLLFTTAGMVQFKDVFLGKDERPYTRATSAQKCVRAGGKHNDLENVGFTARHHTFFEMLGNFSFGDYFKKEAIRFAWEFVTQELSLPIDKLYVTVFETDDEAAEIWHKQEGVALDRIFRFGEKDNFWSMGDTGPCGPCSEIFVDRGEKYGCGKSSCGMGCDCDRYMEIWNLVFMQYNRDAKGVLNPLPKPSVDTGSGLERVASVLQGTETNYETDDFQYIIQKTALLAGIPYDTKHDTVVSFRVIADHSRAAAFLIGDGVMPSNEGRGYVLRRIMRRAIRHGKKLGFTGPFLNQTAGFVVDLMSEAYPDLKDKKAFIQKAILAEEEQFLKTLEKGLSLLEEETAKLSGKVVPGAVAFKLYDTFGFPLDLTRVISEEKGLTIDEKGFQTEMARQKAESRKSWKGSGQESLDGIYLKLTNDLKTKKQLPEFVGFDHLDAEGQCLAILKVTQKGIESVNEAHASALSQSADSEDDFTFEAVFSKTPFYGEGGGQVGDRGRVTGHGLEADVIDVQKPTPDLTVVHLKLKKGMIKVGQTYTQMTDRELRDLSARNHTATHLLHWALRDQLGSHVKQAGSIVTPDLLRFDFSHFEPMTPVQLRKIEDMINEKIWLGHGVKKQVMNKDQAIAAGAIAFFGEKYGDQVRVVSVGDFSTELCGGTHVNSASEIHMFKIASESGIAAGVRRIVAHTSKGAFEYLRNRNDLATQIRDQVKAQSVEELPIKIDRILAGEKELRRQIEQIQAKASAGDADRLLNEAKRVKDFRLVGGVLAADSQGVKKLRDMAEVLKNKAKDAVIVIGMNEQGKAHLIVACGSDAQKKVSASDLLKKLSPLIEGRGGGKPDFAQAGGTKVSGLEEAVRSAETFL